MRAIQNILKSVAVGKRGSRDIPVSEIEDVLRDLCDPECPKSAKGALVGALIMKGGTVEEGPLLEIFGQGISANSDKLLEYQGEQLGDSIREIFHKILNQDTLDIKEAYRLGRFLVDAEASPFWKGLAATVLRVRYESAEEYEGLLRSFESGFSQQLTELPASGTPIVQIAEPFDGMLRSYGVTLLLAASLREKGYRVVHLSGRNSGPKKGVNISDLAAPLEIPFLHHSRDLNRESVFGHILHQKDLSEEMDHWVDLRREIIKRPFMATLERCVNPFNADITIVSAFHPPYGEKMRTICESAGFRNIIVIRNGMEGGISLPLLRPAKILTSSPGPDNQIHHRDLTVNPSDIVDSLPVREETFDAIDENKAVQLIRDYRMSGRTDLATFDQRVTLTTRVLIPMIETLCPMKEAAA